MGDKRFFNNFENCVDESLRGFVRLYPGLRYHEPHRFVTKNKIEVTSRVAILSGGGSGHEPFCVGFVGNGMISGAVAGNIFASPPKTHILQAIRFLHKYFQGGVLVIIPNYTGDRLNFGMAIETAKFENLNVDSIAIGEDCASKHTLIGGRGMCGLIFAYKIAGALSVNGKKLHEILETLNRVKENMFTLGVSSKPCSLPGQRPLFSMSNNELELGTGVHGEAGLKKIEFTDVKTIVTKVLDEIFNQIPIKNEKLPLAVLVNNLGTTTELELNIICNNVYCQLKDKGHLIRRMYSGNLMTSLDMSGFQISILYFNENNEKEWLALLDAETDAPRWIGSDLTKFVPYESDIIINYEEPPKENVISKFILTQSQKELFKSCLSAATSALIKTESKLNELDSGCGDGDCGSTLKSLAIGINDLILSDLTYEFRSPIDVLDKLAVIAETKMGGTSGAIYSLCFSSMRNYMLKVSHNNLPLAWSEAWVEGISNIQKYAGARESNRTIIDALVPSSTTFHTAIKSKTENDVKRALADAVVEAKKGCDRTKYMDPRVGRASYVSQDRITDVDAGAYGFVTWFSAIADCYE